MYLIEIKGIQKHGGNEMGDLGEIVKKGDKIQIFLCNEQMSPDIWEVTAKSRATITLTNVQTSKSHCVHKSRIAKIIVEGEEMKEVQEAMETKTKKEKPVAKPKKEKEKVERVDFKGMLESGCEIWSMPVDFNDKAGQPVPNIKAEAHCVIAADTKSFRVFNTFNGSLGKSSKKRDKAPLGVEYPLADEKALEKKRKALQKKGYKRRPGTKTVALNS